MLSAIIHMQYTNADYYASKSLFGLNADAALTEALSFGITILKNAKSLEKEDVIERAWHFVEDWVASNKSRFDNLAAPCYGKIESGKVYIIASVLREALTDNGFNYTKSIKGFKDKGYINTFVNYSQVSRHKKVQFFLGEQAILSAPNIKLPLHLA